MSFRLIIYSDDGMPPLHLNFVPIANAESQAAIDALAALINGIAEQVRVVVSPVQAAVAVVGEPPMAYAVAVGNIEINDVNASAPPKDWT
jgi:hypothetical protein